VKAFNVEPESMRFNRAAIRRRRGLQSVYQPQKAARASGESEYNPSPFGGIAASNHLKGKRQEQVKSRQREQKNEASMKLTKQEKKIKRAKHRKNPLRDCSPL